MASARAPRSTNVAPIVACQSPQSPPASLGGAPTTTFARGGSTVTRVASAAAFGAKIIRAPKLFHGKTSEIEHDGKGIYHGVATPLTAMRYHSLIVERRSLPRSLQVSAETRGGVIMGLRHRKFKVEGVQFHPESVLTESGKQILQNFLGL